MTLAVGRIGAPPSWSGSAICSARRSVGQPASTSPGVTGRRLDATSLSTALRGGGASTGRRHGGAFASVRQRQVLARGAPAHAGAHPGRRAPPGAGAEYLLCAGSIEQARLCFRFVRAWLEPTEAYRFLDSATRIGITHRLTNTRLRVLSSNGKTAMGIVGCPLLVADEPGSWEVVGGQLMHDAIETAKGKPGSPLRAVYIGTLAPATSGWWHDLIEEGSHGSTHVTALRGDPEKWDRWSEIRRCNPLTAISPEFRSKLLEERDAATRADSRLKSRFLSYRLNVPSAGDESTVLLTVDDWRGVRAREVSERMGRPVVGVDLGGGRAWSAAVALWPSGRTEARRLIRRGENCHAIYVDRGRLQLIEGSFWDVQGAARRPWQYRVHVDRAKHDRPCPPTAPAVSKRRPKRWSTLHRPTWSACGVRRAWRSPRGGECGRRARRCG